MATNVINILISSKIGNKRNELSCGKIMVMILNIAPQGVKRGPKQTFYQNIWEVIKLMIKNKQK